MNSYAIIAWLGKHVGRRADLCLDSRQIKTGDVFFACPGKSADGRDYIKQAINKGAAAVVLESGREEVLKDITVPYAQVKNLSKILGYVGHHWYREPSHALTVIAVTGTNGKTTCVNWIAEALNFQGTPCGTIGTLGVIRPDGSNLGGELTTPDVLTMHRSLAALRDSGAIVVALEASSIGIHQGRLDQVKVEIAAFTNLSHDHLDYHLSYENYQNAKFKLFSWPRLGSVIINLDDDVAQSLLQKTSVSTRLTYSMQEDISADIKASDIQSSGSGLMFNLITPRGSAQLLTSLVGLHNVSNILLVSAVLRQLGWGMARIVKTIATLEPVDGRLQVVEAPELGQSAPVPMVVVDYSHTPDSLQRALIALRQTANTRGGNLICMFGCGGARDASKRPIMGKIAQELSDYVLLTNDNPRNESAKEIIKQIVSGMNDPVDIEYDRAKAILKCIFEADERDVILLAGKGHETTQEFADKTVYFDDRQWAKLALSLLRNPNISTDTRTIQADDLFWAIKGENFDGQDYIGDACMAGASAAVVDRADFTVPIQQIEVGDTKRALSLSAQMWRNRFNIPVIGVTGSNGKTTTKEIISCILQQWQTEQFMLSTRGNLNNDLGVPLTVLRMRSYHLAAVIEMGMNHPGEIEDLANIAKPTIALVNNAQREHQEFMHTVDAVAKENGSVFYNLPDTGVAVFPGDDKYTDLWHEMSGSRPAMVFGFDEGFDVYASDIKAKTDSTEFILHTALAASPVKLNAQGRHNLRNALAAATTALACNIPLAIIVRGIQAFNPVSGRLQTHVLENGWQIIDDTYNANPDSVMAAIDVLAQLNGNKVLVLGDMGEIGSASKTAHEEVGLYAKNKGINILLTLGQESENSANAFGENSASFDQLDSLLEKLYTQLPANVLVKGSRSARMERVVQALINHLNAVPNNRTV